MRGSACPKANAKGWSDPFFYAMIFIMRSKAFTLLEVMIVMLIMAAVFFPLLQMLSSGLLVSGEAKDTNNAVIIAQKKLESLKNTSYINITSESEATVEGSSAYRREVIITEPYTNLKNVRVIISWDLGEGSEGNISIETLVSNF